MLLVSQLRTCLLSALVVVLAASTSSALEATKTGTDLTSTNFAPTLASGRWLVEFFSPYCHHCKSFLPTWSTLVEMHEHLAESSDFHFARVDCISQGDVCAAQDIKGYPTLSIYTDGALTGEYKGDRTFELLSTYILFQAAEYKKMKAEVPPQGGI